MANSSQLTSPPVDGLLSTLVGKVRGRQGSAPIRLAASSLPTWLGWIALVGGALVLGYLIANEQWLYLGLLAALVIALLWPVEVALGSYVFLLPFQYIATLGHSFAVVTVNRLLGAVAAIAIIIAGTVRKRIQWPARASLWWFLFLLWGLLSIVWALQPEASRQWLPTVVPLVFLYLVVGAWRFTAKEVSVLSWLIILGGCLAAAFTIYQFHNGVTYNVWVDTGRATLAAGGQESNPNFLGTDLLLPFALSVAWFVGTPRKFHAVVALALAGTVAYATYATMSRGSMIAMAVVVGIFVLRLGLTRRMMLMGSALLLLLLTMPSGFFYRIQTALSSGGAGRLEIWDVGFVLLKRFWLFGAGLVNFPIAYTEFAGHASRFVGYGRGAHNVYLSAAVEFGIVGFVLLVVAVVSHLRALQRLRLASPLPTVRVVAFEGACWGMLAAGFFEDITWLKSFWLAWMLALIVISIGPKLSTEPLPHRTEVPVEW